MDVRELRIGNFVQDSLGIIEIGKTGRIDFASVYTPIVITEDWLCNFGFIKSKNFLYLQIPEISSELHYEIKEYGNVFVFKSNLGEFIPDDIYHVHHLQNLYYAITHKELIKKL